MLRCQTKEMQRALGEAVFQSADAEGKEVNEEEEDEEDEDEDEDELRLCLFDLRRCLSTGDRLGGVFPRDETLFGGGVLGIATFSFWKVSAKVW